eukprot:1549797-Rhodomonas_salina.1
MDADRPWRWISPTALWPDGPPLGACAPDTAAVEGPNRRAPQVARLRYTQVRRRIINGSWVGGAEQAE